MVSKSLQQTIQARDCKACVVLNPATPAESIREVLPDVDQVLVMSVNPGFGGQKFIESQLQKVAKIRSWIDELERPIDLEIDGGIGTGTIGRAAQAGANAFVAGTAVFRAPDLQGAITELRKEAEGARSGH